MRTQRPTQDTDFGISLSSIVALPCSDSVTSGSSYSDFDTFYVLSQVISYIISFNTQHGWQYYYVHFRVKESGG